MVAVSCRRLPCQGELQFSPSWVLILDELLLIESDIGYLRYILSIYIYLQSRVAFKVACTTFITPFHRNYTKKGHEVRRAMSQRWVFCPGNVKASLAFHVPSGCQILRLCLCCMLQYLSHPQSPWYFFKIHWIRSKVSIFSFRMSIKFMHDIIYPTTKYICTLYTLRGWISNRSINRWHRS